MRQAITRFSRAFASDEGSKADLILTQLQSLLISHGLFGLKRASQLLWNEGRDVRIVDSYSWHGNTEEVGVATIHRWKREGRILFLSVVMGVGGELAGEIGELLSIYSFVPGAHPLPEELCPEGISGWHDLVAPGADLALVRFSIKSPSDARPTAGGIATR